MLEKDILSKKSLLDFSYMFFSNLIKKGLGFVREIILAFFFGSSVSYANYLLLKTVADFFSQLTLGNALQANLLPKFSKLFLLGNTINLSEVLSFSRSFSIKLFLISQLIQIPMIWYIDFNDKILFLVISILLGVVMSCNFFNSIFLTFLQAKGSFKQHSVATTLNLFISTLFLYPFAIFLSFIGVVLSRLAGILSLTFTYIKPLLKEKGSVKAELSISDFNFSIMFLGNLANIIIIIARFMAGSDGGNQITYFTYAVVILNTLLTALIMNVNTLVLKSISVKKSFRLILFSSFLSLIVGIALLIFVNTYSINFISFLFERGKFISLDTIETARYLQGLSLSFVFLFLGTTMIQPFFTLDYKTLKQASKRFVALFIIITSFSIGFLSLFVNSIQRSTILLMLIMSITYFIISLLSLFKYRRYVV